MEGLGVILTILACLHVSIIVTCLVLKDSDGQVFDMDSGSRFDSRPSIKFNLGCLIVEALIAWIFIF